ncbi:MAG: hypothetical protein VW644_10600 [Alphaproteobacteria bacterium]
MFDRLLRCVGPMLVAAGLLVGCTTAPEPPKFAELTYAYLGTMNFDAMQIEIVDEYRPPLKDPNIEHKVPQPPGLAMRRWAIDRLAATGNPDRRAVFTIQQAALTETPLPRTTGLRGAVTTDQTEKYELTLAGRFEIYEGRTRVGIATASVARSQTIAEDATLNDRDRVLFTMVEQAMLDFNKQMETGIHQFLGRYMR